MGRKAKASDKAPIQASNNANQEETMNEKEGNAINSETIKQAISQTLHKNLADLLNNSENMTQFIEKIANKVTESLSNYISAFQDNISREIHSINKNVIMSAEVIDLIDQRLNSVEQYQRKDSLRILGVPFSDDEDTEDIFRKTIMENLKIELMPNDISICHRLPLRKGKTNSPPDMIVKFVKYKTRMLIYNKKRLLKGKNIVILENLTKYNYHLLMESKKKYGSNSVWTTDGKIRVKTQNGHIHTVLNKQQLDSINYSQCDK